MTQIATALGIAPGRTRGQSQGRFRGRAFDVDGMIALWRQRRALARLDDRALADIGVTRPAWDVPTTWCD